MKQGVAGSRVRSKLPEFRHASKIATARIGDFNRSMKPFVARAARSAMAVGYVAGVRAEHREQQHPLRLFAKAVMRDITNPKALGSVSDEPMGIDPVLSARASEAAATVYARYEGLINAVREDRSLTPEQRAGIIVALRARAKVDAKAVSQRIMEQAMGAAKQRKALSRSR